jgi:hypothetical protein
LAGRFAQSTAKTVSSQPVWCIVGIAVLQALLPRRSQYCIGQATPKFANIHHRGACYPECALQTVGEFTVKRRLSDKIMDALQTALSQGRDEVARRLELIHQSLTEDEYDYEQERRRRVDAELDEEDEKET